ncbi:hypothetical protein PRUPE_6G282200 [Prunus persica]|uniref:BZIP domain-containing protein n=1 Tax=Prunus persica TaxID=3760 RepID=A0A251NWW1_PRUPE|nr:basic leucine zipper 6-like [Prunus persica]ONI03789.1 hypothetical protein PRUPE_6G282200 [Prunus persica]
MEQQQAKTSAGNHSQSAASGSTSSPENKSSQMETIQSPNPIPSSTGDAGPSDPKQLRRILANREAARRAHSRKKEYERKLEREAKEAEERVAMLASKVAFQRMHLTILSGKNSQMRETLQVLENHQAHKEAETEALVKERETLLLLRSLQLQQQQGGSSRSSNNPNNVDK